MPGAQALLGFQLVVTLTGRFNELSPALKNLHLAALCSVALSVIVLMTPAALHRVAFGGEDSEAFLAAGSSCVIVAPFFLGLGITGDVYVATWAAVQSAILGLVLAIGTFGVPRYALVWTAPRSQAPLLGWGMRSLAFPVGDATWSKKLAAKNGGARGGDSNRVRSCRRVCYRLNMRPAIK